MSGVVPADEKLNDWYELVKQVHYAIEYGLHCNDLSFGEIEDEISSALDQYAEKNGLPVHDWDTDYEDQYGNSGEENPD